MVGVERKMAKDHISHDARAYGDKILEAELGCSESLSFCRRCRVEMEPIALPREVSPLAGPCVLKTCRSFRWLLKGAY